MIKRTHGVMHASRAYVGIVIGSACNRSILSKHWSAEMSAFFRPSAVLTGQADELLGAQAMALQACAKPSGNIKDVGRQPWTSIASRYLAKVHVLDGAFSLRL